MEAEAEIDLKRTGIGSVQRFGTSHLGEDERETIVIKIHCMKKILSIKKLK